MMRYSPGAGFPRIVPELRYRDAAAAVGWLCRNFGFVELLRLTGAEGLVVHSELELEHGLVMIATGPDSMSLPNAPDGYPVQIIIFVQDVHDHFRRSESQGARILSPPRDQPWGLLQSLALDLEGHGWQFTQYIENVSPENWGAVWMK